MSADALAKLYPEQGSGYPGPLDPLACALCALFPETPSVPSHLAPFLCEPIIERARRAQKPLH
jgi:hypothetical protein